VALRSSETLQDCATRRDHAAYLLRRALADSGLASGTDAAMIVPTSSAHPSGCEVMAWAASGAMWLTGQPGQAPVALSAPVISRLAGASTVLAALTESLGNRVDIAVATLLGARAALLRLTRQGQISPGGSCRLLPAGNGWVAVNLARPDDVAAVPALTQEDGKGDPWDALRTATRRRSAHRLVVRAQMLGVPAAALPPRAPATTTPPFVVSELGKPEDKTRRRVVVDLSSMWAGPQCAQLLGRAGMRVIKVESTSRPDGTRKGPSAFFDWLHAGHESVALDLTTSAGVNALHWLVHSADVVIESSRPRALRQFAIDAESVVSSRPGVTWISITGYGRTGAGADWVAFGDDAAVAGGLVGWDQSGAPVFAGDAMADPVTGLYAAIAAVASQLAGGGHLIDVRMLNAARWLVADELDIPSHPIKEVGHDRWLVYHGDHYQEVQRPGPPPLGRNAAPLGADTDRVLAEFR
jgi:crotonobetainyl-CoA:carnitine CoA-transferase CaiB-like acyl-CoA transferase